MRYYFQRALLSLCLFQRRWINLDYNQFETDWSKKYEEQLHWENHFSAWLNWNYLAYNHEKH